MQQYSKRPTRILLEFKLSLLDLGDECREPAGLFGYYIGHSRSSLRYLYMCFIVFVIAGFFANPKLAID